MNKKITKILGGSTVVGLVLSTLISATNVQASQVNVGRFEGADRYETAANVAKSNWINGKTDNVILVSGQGYADALSASLLAQKLNAPILLTEKDELNKNTYEAINKLGAKNVYILGLQGVISDNIKDSLEKQGKKVIRLGGSNRFKTNIAIANELVNNHKVNPNEVLVVNGNKYLVDALTAAPVAAKEGKILLLVGEDENLAKEAKQFINNYKSKVTVIGTNNTVSDAIYNQLGATKRINGGKDRFETNRLILDAFNMKSTYVCVANGQTNHLVDSLVASALAGKHKSPIVIISNNIETDSKIIDYMKNKLKINTESKLVVLGGKKILSEDFVEKIGKIASTTKVANDEIKPEENPSKKFLDVVKEDGKTSIDEDDKTPGIQISLTNKDLIKIKLVEKDTKTTEVKVINDKLIDLGKDSVVSKIESGETITLTAIKEGKSIITIKHGSQKLDLEVTVKKLDLDPVSGNEGNGLPKIDPIPVNPIKPAPVHPEPAPIKPVPDPIIPVPAPIHSEPEIINKVILAPGSVKGAVPGSKKITVLSGKKYKVIINEQEKYVKANGELSGNAEDAAALIGTEIIGLTNGKQYKVEEIIENSEKELIKNSKVELKSEIVKHGLKGMLGNEQKSHVKINVFANNGLLQKDQDITIAGRIVRVNKGDNPVAIRSKIINAFKDDKNWIAENIFVVSRGNEPVIVTLTSKKHVKNDGKLGIDNSEIKFTQEDVMYGRLGIPEVREICNITVTNVSNKQETINVNVTGEKNSQLNVNVSVDVKPTDTTKNVSRSIYNAFQANEQLREVYHMVLDEENSRIILTQNRGDLLDTKVTIN